MIRSYTVSELEQMSGCTRRTISDYIAKGVLAGPSHRGRGARYPQKDLDVLTLLPRIRTLMKKEYPTLKEVSAFLANLSVRDINRLATRVSEDAFVSEVRRLRVRNSLMSLLPYVPPERIETMLAQFTPGQIGGIDAGRYQIGAVMDIESLLHEEGSAHRAVGQQPDLKNSFGALGQMQQTQGQKPEQRGQTDTAWNGWLKGQEEHQGPEAALDARDHDTASDPRGDAGDRFADTTTDLEAMARDEATQPDLPIVRTPVIQKKEGVNVDISERLTEIAQRLKKLESLLDKA